jgi:hypothetical protein
MDQGTTKTASRACSRLPHPGQSEKERPAIDRSPESFMRLRATCTQHVHQRQHRRNPSASTLYLHAAACRALTQQQISNGVDAKAGQGPGLPGLHPPVTALAPPVQALSPARHRMHGNGEWCGWPHCRMRHHAAWSTPPLSRGPAGDVQQPCCCGATHQGVDALAPHAGHVVACTQEHSKLSTGWQALCCCSWRRRWYSRKHEPCLHAKRCAQLRVGR